LGSRSEGGEEDVDPGVDHESIPLVGRRRPNRAQPAGLFDRVAQLAGGVVAVLEVAPGRTHLLQRGHEIDRLHSIAGLGVDGHGGYLLRQAWRVLEGAMEVALRPHRLTPVQYGVLSVLAREPGASGADLARAVNTTPQAMNGVLATLEREGLVERRPHPTHGRIPQPHLPPGAGRRVGATLPPAQRPEGATGEGSPAAEAAAAKGGLGTPRTGA